MRAVLPGHRHVRGGEMRSPGVLPLLHEDAGAVRAEVLRRLPGTARQGAAASPPAASAGLGCFTPHLLTAQQSRATPLPVTSVSTYHGSGRVCRVARSDDKLSRKSLTFVQLCLLR